MGQRLLGRVALVTGASRGIGRGIAVALAEEGADVAVNHVSNPEAAAETAEYVRKAGRRAFVVKADVSNSGEVAEMVDACLSTFGRIDILVNNAGVISRATVLDMDEREWDRVLGVNLKGCFLVSQAVARHMAQRRSGTIINVSSQGQDFGAKGRAHYCASKAGVRMLTAVMALELAEYGIRVNGIAPGLTATDMNRWVTGDPAVLEERLRHIPARRVGTPADMGRVVAFLASDESAFIVGQTLMVDGGDSLWLDTVPRRGS